MEERLQKFMARCGVDSRRKCEELIARGVVEVNGEVVREPGVKIDPARDRVFVEGRRLRVESPAYYLHYKVKGVTTTVSDDLGRRTVMDCLPEIRERVYPVGRLDKESEGLLVLTNDGELANYLTHPAHGIEKTYRVVAEGRVPAETLAELEAKGLRLGPVLVKPSRVELVRHDNDNTVVLISVSEGINREVRRIFAALGHEVKKLLRIRVGPLGLEGMKRGGTRPLTDRELAVLKKGMSGMGGAAAAERFPAGSARERKPSGPRGRPRRVKAPRRGKPDPAAAAAPEGDRKARGAVVIDEWSKRTGKKRPPAGAGARERGGPAKDAAANAGRTRGGAAGAGRDKGGAAPERFPKERSPNERFSKKRLTEERAPKERFAKGRPPKERSLNEHSPKERFSKERTPKERAPAGRRASPERRKGARGGSASHPLADRRGRKGGDDG